MNRLRAHLFGTLRLERGGRLLEPFPTQKSRALCAYLLLFGRRPQLRLRLAGLLWGDMPERRARRALSDALWRLKQVAGEDLVVEDDRGLRLSPEARLWIDVEEFHRLTRPLRRGEQPEGEALEGLREAVRLYRGDLLEDFYDEWVLAERERCRSLYLGALRVLIRASDEAGRLDEALGYAEQLVRADSLHEEAQRWLMRLYAKAGYPELALEQFRSLERLLDQTLGVRPTEKTRRLARRIEAEARVREAESPGPAGLLPVVGRLEERRCLVERLHALAHGQGWGALILGEEGIGKSRLAVVALEGARWRGIGVTHQHCRSPQDAPYAPFLRVLRAMRSRRWRPVLESRLRPGERQLLERLMSVDEGLHPTYAGHLEPSAAVSRVIARAIASLGLLGPWLLVLEDVHLADEATLAALEALLPLAPREGLGLLLTACHPVPENGQGPRDWLTRLEAAGLNEVLWLGPLGEEEVGELLAHALGEGKPSPAAVRALTRVSGGNPFFLLELVEDFRRRGQGDWQAYLAALPVSPRVQAVVEGRLECLSPQEADLLAQAAILGERVDIEVLEAAADLDREAFLALSGALLRAGILTEKEGTLVFSHQLTRQVVLTRIREEERRRYHLRAAEALERFVPEEVEARAEHLEAAGDWSRAWEALRAAARRALRAAQYDRALGLYDRALQSVARAGGVPTETRLQLLWEKGTVFQASGVVAQAEEAAQALIAEGERAGPLWKGRGWLLLSNVRYFEGDFEASRQAAEKAIRLARQAEDPALEGMALLNLILAAPAGEPFERRRQRVESEALPLLAAAGSREGMLEAHSLLGGLALRQCRLREAQRHYLWARDLARELGWISRYWMMVANLAEVEYERGRLERALSLGQTAYQAFERLDIPYGQAGTADILAWVYLALGLPAQALEWARRNEVRARRMGTLLWQFFAHMVQALALAEMDDLEASIEEARRAGLLAEDLGEAHALASAHWVRGRLALLQGEAAEGLQLVETAWERVLQNGLWFLGVRVAAERARARLAAMDFEAARRAAAEALAVRRRIRGPVCYGEEVHLAAAAVYQAVGEQARRERSRRRAWEEVAERAAVLRDPALRRVFLERRPAHDLLPSVAHSPASPWRLVYLPGLEADGGRVPVVWRPGSPLPRRRSERRRLLRRLLRQTALQRARPDTGVLAQMLGVSERTVREDLKALRQ